MKRLTGGLAALLLAGALFVALALPASASPCPVDQPTDLGWTWNSTITHVFDGGYDIGLGQQIGIHICQGSLLGTPIFVAEAFLDNTGWNYTTGQAYPMTWSDRQSLGKNSGQQVFWTRTVVTYTSDDAMLTPFFGFFNCGDVIDVSDFTNAYGAFSGPWNLPFESHRLFLC